MKWIKYQIVCGKNEHGEDILLNKKVGYSNENLAIAEEEAYDGYEIVDDEQSFEKEPLAIEFGGTNAKTPKKACENIGAIPVPEDLSMQEGYVYRKPDGTTKLILQQKLFKYSVIVDNGSDGTPSAVEYADDCVGFVPMTMKNGVLNEGSWTNNSLLEMFKPCVIAPEDELPKYYLDKTNMSKKIDGTTAVLTGKDGDVMVEVDGLLYGKFEKISNTKFKVSILNYNEQGCFCFNDFGAEIKERFYRGCYKAGFASGDESQMRSISGVTPSQFLTREQFRTRAVLRGEGYHQNNIYMLFLWQIMFLLLFKDRNSQSALGNGIVQADDIRECGWSKNYGWIWGKQDSKTDGVVFLGIEDFYGNLCEFVDGCVLEDLTYKLTRKPEKYNDTGLDFEISDISGFSSREPDETGYVKAVKGTNDLGFLPTLIKGNDTSSITYYCDRSFYNSKDNYYEAPYFGGGYFDGLDAGAFCMYFNSIGLGDEITSRLCRK